MIRQLVTTLGLNRRRSATARQESGNTRWCSVFAIDSDQESLTTIASVLDERGYQVQTALTADSGRRTLGHLRPDVILTDPDLLADDGTRLGHWLVGEESLIGTPVVALKESGMRGPAGPGSYGLYDGVLVKPIDAAALPLQMAALSRSVQQVDGSDSPANPLAAGSEFDSMLHAETLLAGENGLPDSRSLLMLQAGLTQLAAATGKAQQAYLSAGLRLATALSTAATARGRWCYRALIRLCRETVRGECVAGPDMAKLRAQYVNRRSTELAVLAVALECGDFRTIGETGRNLRSTGSAYGFAEFTEIGQALETGAKSGDAEAVDSMLLCLQVYLSMVQSIFGDAPETPDSEFATEFVGRRRDSPPIGGRERQ